MPNTGRRTSIAKRLLPSFEWESAPHYERPPYAMPYQPTRIHAEKNSQLPPSADKAIKRMEVVIDNCCQESEERIQDWKTGIFKQKEYIGLSESINDIKKKHKAAKENHSVPPEELTERIGRYYSRVDGAIEELRQHVKDIFDKEARELEKTYDKVLNDLEESVKKIG